MIETRVVIQAEIGLHARPVALLVQEAQKYQSKVTLYCNGRRANANSVISVLWMGASNGMEVTISASGTDEAAAVSGIQQLIAANFSD